MVFLNRSVIDQQIVIIAIGLFTDNMDYREVIDYKWLKLV